MIVIITAHSGSDGLISNSLNYLRTATKWSIDALEIDVRRAADTTLILSHDYTMTAPLTLEDAFIDIQKSTSQCLINCDLKDVGIATEVMKMATKFELQQRLIFTGAATKADQLEFGEKLWRNIDTILPNSTFERLLQDRDFFESALIQAKDEGAVWINIPYRLLHPLNLELLKVSGLKISVWTAEDLLTVRYLENYGFDNITTLAAHDYEIFLEGTKENE